MLTYIRTSNVLKAFAGFLNSTLGLVLLTIIVALTPLVFIALSVNSILNLLLFYAFTLVTLIIKMAEMIVNLISRKLKTISGSWA